MPPKKGRSRLSLTEASIQEMRERMFESLEYVFTAATIHLNFSALPYYLAAREQLGSAKH